jgi:Cft2 family RNA processing exonuclease
MLTLNRYPLWLVLTSCLLAYGCSSAKELGKTLGDLANVRSELIKKFGENDVNVRANTFENRTSISVIYVNSPLNEKTTDERAKRAQETAEIVKQHYPSIKNVGQIWVGFMRATTRLVIFHWSEMIEGYGFDNEARALRDPGMAPSDPSKPMVQYWASQNKTDISCGGIQLEGTPKKGVLVVPYFSVAGDVNKVKPKPPDEVALDFAAFSEKPKFPNLTKIIFLSDNKIVYRTEGQFSTSKIADDTYSEFLYLKVPTAVFLKIASGSVVKIKLNEHEYTLTESQILQIQRMSDYLR